MDVFPAIDIRNGRVVRLARGEPSAETAYHPDPVAMAERFVWQGARWIHLVDLDRAFGDGENTALVDRIVTRVGSHIQIQLGGGLRTREDIERVRHCDVTRLVLGTAAVETPELVGEAVRSLGPARIAVALDVRDGKVALRGWTSTSTLSAVDVIRRMHTEGVQTVVYTDIARDGMLTGADVEGAVALQREGVSVVLSGGVASTDDIRRAAAAGLLGVILGRALYEDRFTLREAVGASSPPLP